jgi:WD40 repeat protein
MSEIDPITYSNEVNVEIKSAHVYEEHTNSLEVVKFSPTEANIFATGSHDKTIKIWDVEKSQAIQTISGHQKGVWSLDWHHQGKLIVSTSPDGQIIVTDLSSGKEVHRFKGSFDMGYWVEFSKEDNSFIAGGLNGNLEKYSTDSWKLTSSVSFDHSIVYAARYFNNGTKIATCDSLGRLTLFDHNLKQELQKKLTNNEIRTLAIRGNEIITAFDNGNLKFYDVGANDLKLVHDLKGHSDLVHAVHYDAGSKLIFSGAKDSSIFCWEATNFKFVHNLVGHIDQISSLDTNANGKLLVSASWDQTARVYRIADILNA